MTTREDTDALRYAGELGRGLRSPAGLAVHGDRLWVADTYAGRVHGYDLRRPGRAEVVLGDGVLREPRDVAADDEHVYVADSATDSVEVFDHRGRHRTRVGRGELVSARGVAVDDTGRLLVSDVGNNRVAVYDRGSHRLVGSITDGVHVPQGIAPDATGFWLVDTSRQYDGNCAAVRFESDRPGTSLGKGQHSTFGSLSNPAFVAVAPSGRVLVTDPDFGMVLRFEPTGAFVDEAGTQGRALLRRPLGVVVAPDGSVLVADSGNRRVVRFEEVS